MFQPGGATSLHSGAVSMSMSMSQTALGHSEMPHSPSTTEASTGLEIG